MSKRRKKTTSFEEKQTRSVFLYGKPNLDKRETLFAIQSAYTDAVNRYIDILINDTVHLVPIIKNSRKDGDLRVLEKANRIEELNSAYSQNAFDEALAKVSQWYNDIRIDMCEDTFDIFVASKVLFAMALQNATKEEMTAVMEDIASSSKQKFHKDVVDKLKAMDDKTFNFRMAEFTVQYDNASLCRKVPHLKNAQVPVDGRIGSFEKSTDTTCPYVVSLSHPHKRGQKITVPVNTTKNSIRRLEQYDHAGTWFFQIKKQSMKVSVAFEKKVSADDYTSMVGVDIGITDALYLSSGKAIGSMNEVILFYKENVEPAFAYLSDLRNKKRNIRYYLHSHNLPADVRRSLIDKMDRLEGMIREANAPYRKRRRYYQMLDIAIKNIVLDYIRSTNDKTLTILEKLDITEFSKSRTVNGMFSAFARGKLSSRLMEQLNWYGRDFVEVEPAYTSQTCPVCGHIHSDNRNDKVFKCTKCGHTDDADHNASVNIKERFANDDIRKLLDSITSPAQIREKLTGFYADKTAAPASAGK